MWLLTVNSGKVKEGWGSCVTRRSVTPFISWVDNPHHFHAIVLKRMLCVQSCSALSQPQLYHFKRLWTACLQAADHWLYRISLHSRVQYMYNTQEHRFHFLCSRLSSSGTMFSQCEKENTQDVLYCWLQNNGVSLITRCYPNALFPLFFLCAFFLSMVWVSHSCVRWDWWWFVAL